jgi:hypothetical protein
MRWIKTVVCEVWGLFVDDIRFAIAILVWLAIVAFAFTRTGLPSNLGGPILFLGLAVILFESALRKAVKYHGTVD